MATLENKYLGELRTVAVHSKTKNEVITDAPIDNQGKGEAFSPTDLLCAALSSCMLTVMGIEARKLGVDMKGMTTEVNKFMNADPRKVAKIKVVMSHPGLKATEEQKEALRKAAKTCPVALSLSAELHQEAEFNF